MTNLSSSTSRSSKTYEVCSWAVKFIGQTSQWLTKSLSANILAAYDPEGYTAKPFYDFAAAQKAAEGVELISELPEGSTVGGAGVPKRSIEGQRQLAEWKLQVHDDVNLELLLFRDILEISVGALRYLAELTSNDRGYVESVVLASGIRR